MTTRAPKPEPTEQSVHDVTPAADEAPPYYIADAALFIDFARAFNVGDRVPVEHVTRYGWHDQVHAPEQTPTNEPESRTGQATTTEKDGA
ncbi:hypothetical protein SAMN05216275_14168 [Streptosporangium canum]|uniref:Uncharacterized protein n=1 Tax=Streptosporangium canum TaxID=324952 RepID=A0A1I4DKW5_9ACTN|nr:hypothetical protein [Streptosporangium canum]SFK92676.1 hypothetical protein SAMN05216275_14168 [Streptosporangium canum]